MDTTSAASNAQPDNPTRAFVAGAVAARRTDVALDVNPALAWLSTILVEATDDTLHLRFTAPPESAQGNGVVGGGTLASMLDIAMAMAVLARLAPGQTCSTISMSVNMQAAGALGGFRAVATVDRLGRTIAFARAELFDERNGRRIANATSSLAVLTERH